MSAQSAFYLKIQVDSTDARLDLPDYRTGPYYTTGQVYRALDSLVGQLHDESYLTAGIDSLAQRDSLYIAHLHIGPAHRWVYLRTDSIPDTYLRQVGYRAARYSDKPFYYRELRALQDALLSYAEDHGYPFATTRLTDVTVARDGAVSASLTLQLRQLIRVGAMRVEGDLNLSVGFLEQYLDLRPGQPYNLGYIRRELPRRLAQLPYVKVARDPVVTFSNNEATITLFLQKQRASRFDFVLGFLPNNSETQTLRVTGTGDLYLANALGRGEVIAGKFRQLRPETQELELQVAYPYLLDLPFGVDGLFELYRRDTTFLDVAYEAGVQYLLGGDDFIKVFWEQKRSTLLSINENAIRNSRRLPEQLDVTYNSFGLAYRRMRLDYRLNPRSGWEAMGRAAAGFRNIRENNLITSLTTTDGFDFSSLYDSLTTRSFSYQLSASGAYYVPVTKRTVLRGGVRAAAIISDLPVYRNEQYRIGGNQLLRGFDEESIFATRYAVFSVEYRLLVGRDSNFYLFGDYAYVEDVTATARRYDRPYGFGAGLTLGTRAGIFNLTYAYGGRDGLPVDFGAAKVHLGYLSVF